jgi:uncharacterized membrane protein
MGDVPAVRRTSVLFHRGSRFWFVAVLLAAAVISIGCVRVTEIDSGSRSINTVNTVAAVVDRYDAAILSIDFSPVPVSYDGDWDTGSTALHVAVDNRGREPLTDLKIVARVTSSVDDGEIAVASDSIRFLAPGEIKMVRLSRTISPPTHSTYWITVQVTPNEDEVNLANNQKVIRLDVTSR